MAYTGPAMNRSTLIAIFALGLLLAPMPFAQEEASEQVESSPSFEKAQLVVVCPINGMIDRGIAVVVERAIEEAEAQNATAVVFVVDTPGGLVDAAIEITRSIQDAECNTISYIEGMGAISAGAIISYACDTIIMAPDSNMGAATPVIASPEGMQETSEKTVSYIRGKMRALAEANGHNPDIAEAMVDKDIELRGRVQEDGTLKVYTSSGGGETVQANAGNTNSTAPARDPMEEIFRVLTPEDAPVPYESPEEVPGSGSGTTELAQAGGEVEDGETVFEDGSRLILPKGKLLTLTASEAEEYGVIPFVVETLDGALTELGYAGFKKITIEPNWAEKVFRFLTNPTISGLLLLIALGGLYFEVQSPGFGLPGIMAIAALGILFGAHYVLGLAEWGELLLLVLGLSLIAAEIFLFPGFGIAGLGGILCLIVGLYLTFTNFTIPQYEWEFERMYDALYSMSLAIVAFLILAVLSWRYMPRSRILNSILVLGDSQQTQAGYVVQTDEEEESAIGLTGVAVTALRPAGKGRFGAKTYQIVSRGEFLDAGTPIRIVQVEGNRYVVDRAEPSTSDLSPQGNSQ